MAEIVHFSPLHELNAQENLAQFIMLCKRDISVFGADLDWSKDHWPNAGVSFGNIDQKSRVLDQDKAMRQPYKDFAKAYFRYQQGHKPTKSKVEMRALRCLERALCTVNPEPYIGDINSGILDNAVMLANEVYSSGVTYQVGRELARLTRFVCEKNLISTNIAWKNPSRRPVDTVRTGSKAKANREKKLPSDEALNALAEIFASNPKGDRDCFTVSVVVMLLSAPSRITEVLALPLDCEVFETKRDGKRAYGWRFMPGKGGSPMVKWIPDAMVTVAQNAISRVFALTKEARQIARWLEKHPDLFYRHANCPRVREFDSLSLTQTAKALGIPFHDISYVKDRLKRFGLPAEDGKNTLRSLNRWVHQRLPKGFPWYDKSRGVRFSEALFCLQDRQLRLDMAASPFMVWKPTNNVFNNPLQSRETSPGNIAPSIFDRYGYNNGRETPLKITSHQFRHLLNTMAQRGGLSQAEIARWSGRVEVKQNRVYDHMSEFELVDMLRSHDTELSLHQPLKEIAEQIASVIPMTQQEFNTLTMPTAHVTEYGFCVHDFVMSPCQRFRDCLNCSEQVCIKGDQRVSRLRLRHEQVKQLKDRADKEIAEGSAGADRWYEVHDFTEKRLAGLISILEDPSIPDGTIIRLRNDQEFSPWRRTIEAKAAVGLISDEQKAILQDLKALQGIDNG